MARISAGARPIEVPVAYRKGMAGACRRDRSSQVHTDHHSAALWLGSAAPLFDVVKRPWLRDIVQSYAPWTYAANGSQLEAHEDVDHPPHEWNGAYFKLVAACLVGLNSLEVREMAIAPITSLPDESFCDILTIFSRNVDDVYFNERGIDKADRGHPR